MEGSLICLVPILVGLILAAITKNAIFSLLIGAVTGCVILAGGSISGSYNTFIDILYQVLMNADTVWVTVLIALFGGLILLMRKSFPGLQKEWSIRVRSRCWQHGFLGLSSSSTIILIIWQWVR